MDKLNNRSGKCLGMNTPNEVFFNINSPNWTSRNLGIAKLPIDAVVTEMLAVVCKVSQGVVDLAYQ